MTDRLSDLDAELVAATPDPLPPLGQHGHPLSEGNHIQRKPQIDDVCSHDPVLLDRMDGSR
ncbi:hypothetical protein [Streptomyces sp. NPDC088725]|uniref:hypothetical protein n=1 Tax=Streptomyces sp. NPDC088725 TaxID=3365873 RepID=UPI00382CDD63